MGGSLTLQVSNAEASRGTYEDGAVAALLIVLVGLIPVILLAKLGKTPR